MSRKTFIIIVISLIILALGFFAYVFIANQKKAQTDGGGVSFRDFFPFGKSTTPDITTPDTNPGTPKNPDETIPQPIEIPRLRQISKMEIAGAFAFDKERFVENSQTEAPETTSAESAQKEPKKEKPPTELVTTVRYVERATGHIYESFVDRIDERKVSNTTIPRVYEALFGDNGSSVLYRLLKDDNKTIQTFSGSLPKDVLGGDGLPELKGVFLSENITDITRSPDGTKIFYLQPFGDGVIGTSSFFGGDKKSQFFNSAFSEWIPGWASNKITLTTKASLFAPGFVYSVDESKGGLTKILGNIIGLTTHTSPTGKKMLYSVSSSKTFGLKILDIESRIANNINTTTLPEKCIWTKDSKTIYCGVPNSIPSGNYPDAWYQGVISFDDSIWKIDVETGITTLLINPNDTGVPLDITNLSLDPKENYIFFINKKDSTLWSYKITE